MLGAGARKELLVDTIAGLIGDVRHAAMGIVADPGGGVAGARDGVCVSLLGSRRQRFFSDGGRELFDCAGQGRIDVFFLRAPRSTGQETSTW